MTTTHIRVKDAKKKKHVETASSAHVPNGKHAIVTIKDTNNKPFATARSRLAYAPNRDIAETNRKTIPLPLSSGLFGFVKIPGTFVIAIIAKTPSATIRGNSDARSKPKYTKIRNVTKIRTHIKVAYIHSLQHGSSIVETASFSTSIFCPAVVNL